MAKVSIGLRGWRFDEDVVFDDDGDFRPLSELDEDTRHRLVRLTAVQGEPCDACWLIHGDEHVDRCAPAEVVYGEPLAEVLLCADHERDFYYWYETEGERHRGTEAFQDRFHEWFAAGGRAPEEYGGVDHVDTDPATVPAPSVPDLEVLNVPLPEEKRDRIDLREYGPDRDAAPEATDEEGDADEGSIDGADDATLDLDVEYPRG